MSFDYSHFLFSPEKLIHSLDYDTPVASLTVILGGKKYSMSLLLTMADLYGSNILDLLNLAAKDSGYFPKRVKFFNSDSEVFYNKVSPAFYNHVSDTGNSFEYHEGNIGELDKLLSLEHSATLDVVDMFFTNSKAKLDHMYFTMFPFNLHNEFDFEASLKKLVVDYMGFIEPSAKAKHVRVIHQHLLKCEKLTHRDFMSENSIIAICRKISNYNSLLASL